METPVSAQTHYMTSFRLKANPGLKKPFIVAVTSEIINWLKEKERSHLGQLGKNFIQQGNWSGRNNLASSIWISPEVGRRDGESPEFWGMHYRHHDNNPSIHRFWYSDVGLRVISDSEIIFSFRVSHAMKPEFIGIAPALPSPSAPRLVSYMIESPAWTALAGGIILRHAPVQVDLGKGQALENLIFNNARGLPVVLINGPLDNQDFPLNPTHLQKLLLGTAIVWWSDFTPEIAEEIAYYLHSDYRCGRRMIRVYLPKADKTNPSDFRRHRFFTERQINEMTLPVVTEAIVSGLARRPRADPLAVVTIADINHVIRERRLEKLRADGKPSAEYIKLLEEENQRLTADSEASGQLLEELEATNHSLEFDVEGLKGNLRNMKASKAESEKITPEDREALAEIIRLPKSQAQPLHCLRALKILYPDRVRLLPSALSSAEDSESFQFVHVLWELLQKLAGDYYTALNNGAGDNVARQVFGQHDYSAKESDTVESGGKYLNYRKFKDGNKTRTMLRHLKIGIKDSKAETIRVHFDWDATERIIIIGHCGPHLPLPS